VRPLGAPGDPRRPAGPGPQPAQGRDQERLPLPGLQPARLDDHHGVGRGVQLAAQAGPHGLAVDGRRRGDGVVEHLVRRPGEQPGQRLGGRAAVDHGEVGRRPRGAALGPVGAVGPVVHPERQGAARPPHHGGEQGVRPAGVADHDVGRPRGQQPGQPAAGLDHGPGAAEPHRLEPVHRRAGGAELVGQAALEAERELRGQARRQLPAAGEGRQQRLDPAVEVAGVAVQDPQGRPHAHGPGTRTGRLRGRAPGSPARTSR
jgi:hypothetical protein